MARVTSLVVLAVCMGPSTAFFGGLGAARSTVVRLAASLFVVAPARRLLFAPARPRVAGGVFDHAR